VLKATKRRFRHSMVRLQLMHAGIGMDEIAVGDEESGKDDGKDDAKDDGNLRLLILDDMGFLLPKFKIQKSDILLYLN
jgi:hypothetical protein